METATSDLYAKAFPVVQSSGTGKSRMLTEVRSLSNVLTLSHDRIVQASKSVFTLPICLRRPDDPGYPSGDVAVHEYFSGLTQDNDISYTTHSAIACFLGALHATMLTRLQEMHNDGHDGRALLEWWHRVMQDEGERVYRKEFFTTVVSEAKSVSCHFYVLTEFITLDQRQAKSSTHGTSPRRKGDGTDPGDVKIEDIAKGFYDNHAEVDTSDLLEFITKLGCDIPKLCVTYFDEADRLDSLMWILLRLISFQSASTAMWYIFMATKSKVSYFHPLVKDCECLLCSGISVPHRQTQFLPLDSEAKRSAYCHLISLLALIKTS